MCNVRSGTIVWMDVLIFQTLATFAFDWLLLWATAAVTRVPASGRRLTAAALLGTIYYAVHVLSGQGLLPLHDLWRSIGVVLLASLAMLFIAFGGGPWKRLLHVAGHFYGIGFVSAGVGTAASFVLSGQAEPDSVVGFLAAGGAILLIAELGWGAVQRRVWQQLYQYPLHVQFDGAERTVTALVDTGNRLRDPLTGEPVIVIEHSVLQPLLPEYLQPAVERMATGDLNAVTRLLASEKWSARFRIIPFSSVGREHGLLVGFKPDAVRLSVDGHPVSVGPCILGISQTALDPDGVYQALVHPELVEAAAVYRTKAAMKSNRNRPVGESVDSGHGQTLERTVSNERRRTGDVARHSEV